VELAPRKFSGTQAMDRGVSSLSQKMANNLFFLQQAGEVAKSFPGSELITMFSNCTTACSFSFFYCWLSRWNGSQFIDRLAV
jgi:hypothetical protein